LVLKAFVEEMVNVVGIGSILEQQEEALDVADQSNDAQKAALEEQRPCLTQMLEKYCTMESTVSLC
jgi:hypothetical protein